MSDTLTLPIDGHEYVIRMPSARIGLAQQAAFTISLNRRANRDREDKGEEPLEPPAQAVKAFEDRYGAASEFDMDRDALGEENYERMLDELTLPRLREAGQAAHFWIALGGSPAGERFALQWVGALEREEPEDLGVETDPKASTPTGEEPTTPPQGSTSDTTYQIESSSV